MKTLVAAMALMLAGQDVPRGGRIEWSADLAAGLGEAGRDGRPVMLYFTEDG